MRSALSDAELDPGAIDLVMLSGLAPNELEAVRELFRACDDPPIVVASSGAFGETFAAGPILSAALALSLSEYVPQNFLVQAPISAPKRLKTRRILVNGISCEGGCGSMIIEGKNVV
jgi:3-oxoacyl-(acyl-carrier-protein) synthase